MQLKKSFSQIERTSLNSLEKNAGTKRAGLGAYIVALKTFIITDIPQKVQENISAVNVENILLTGTIFENRHFSIEEMFYIIKETKSAIRGIR